ncbi:hypothetical protein AVEN_138930-1 [Araneus ventricosus]|uniref:Uncharacterized protein n=1 Tax=Araneus ventricosus TaxID=182803 RepID=A0A4Y2K9T2_ARAVE|nr:hypothetical protein AVEN_138930-1 [Araneus ventricosus]
MENTENLHGAFHREMKGLKRIILRGLTCIECWISQKEPLSRHFLTFSSRSDKAHVSKTGPIHTFKARTNGTRNLISIWIEKGMLETGFYSVVFDG